VDSLNFWFIEKKGGSYGEIIKWQKISQHQYSVEVTICRFFLMTLFLNKITVLAFFSKGKSCFF
jgi:hypothetical protein